MELEVIREKRRMRRFVEVVEGWRLGVPECAGINKAGNFLKPFPSQFGEFAPRSGLQYCYFNCAHAVPEYAL